MSAPRHPDLGSCDFCGKPIGFYGCPTHGVDCYDESLHPDWEEAR